MDDGLRLIGDDATLETVAFGTEKEGDADKTFDELAGGEIASGAGEGFWLITAKAATASIFGALVVGDLFPAEGDEVPIVGDKAKFLTCTAFADCSGWSGNFSAKEVQTSVLSDKAEKYRKGKADFDGEMKGVFTLGQTDASGGLLNQFLRIVHKSSTGTITVSEINSAPVFIRGVVRNAQLSGETFAFMFAQIELFGIKLGADMGNKQEYSSKFRLTGVDPCFYERVLV